MKTLLFNIPSFSGKFVNKVELWQKNNVWDSFSAEFLWGLYCKIKKV